MGPHSAASPRISALGIRLIKMPFLMTLVEEGKGGHRPFGRCRPPYARISRRSYVDYTSPLPVGTFGYGHPFVSFVRAWFTLC